MKLLFIIFILSLSGCTDAAENEKLITQSEICEFSFKDTGPCLYKDIKVSLAVKKIASDEKTLQQLNVEKNGKTFSLSISKDTSILDGDKGFISFADINFDSIPDIAITTSFGLANLYMDYWVYDSSKNKYSYVGNYTKFNIDENNKILSNVVKISAAKYEKATYLWKGFKLLQK